MAATALVGQRARHNPPRPELLPHLVDGAGDRDIAVRLQSLVVGLKEVELIRVDVLGQGRQRDADQLTLFPEKDKQLQTDRDLAIARTVDRVRKKFGRDGIVPGALAERRGSERRTR